MDGKIGISEYRSLRACMYVWGYMGTTVNMDVVILGCRYAEIQGYKEIVICKTCECKWYRIQGSREVSKYIFSKSPLGAKASN